MRGLIPGLAFVCLFTVSEARASDAHRADDDMPPGLRAALHASLAAERYHVQPGQQLGTWIMRNESQNLRTTFASGRVELEGRDELGAWRMRLALEAWGREGSLVPAAEAEGQASLGRFEYRRGAVTEWYMNSERGVEQGFTVAERPEASFRQGAGWLELRLSVDEAAAVELFDDGRSALFHSVDRELFSYTGLSAWDAEGVGWRSASSPGTERSRSSCRTRKRSTRS